MKIPLSRHSAPVIYSFYLASFEKMSCHHHFYSLCFIVIFSNSSLSDMLFLQGSEVIFKVAMSLLRSHKPLILQHDSLESIVDFIKTTLPNLGLVQMEKTINQVRKGDKCVTKGRFIVGFYARHARHARAPCVPKPHAARKAVIGC